MNKNDLLQLAKQMNCEYEPGLTSEINDFLERQKNISKFDLKYCENHFTINIKLKGYNLYEVRNVFSELVGFIEYTSTFYIREEYEDKIEYLLLSSLSNKKAFMCKIIFEG